MKYKYKRGGYREAIEKVEITRESKKCVWEKTLHGERCHKKQSRSEIYYDTWEDAHKCLLSHAESMLNNAKSNVRFAMEKLDEIQAMNNPELD